MLSWAKKAMGSSSSADAPALTSADGSTPAVTTPAPVIDTPATTPAITAPPAQVPSPSPAPQSPFDAPKPVVTPPPAAPAAPVAPPTAPIVPVAPSKDPESGANLEPQLSTYDKVSFRTKSIIRLIFSVLHYLVFSALNVYELWNDFKMLFKLRKFKTFGKPIYKGEPNISRERSFLYAVWGWHVGFVAVFMVLAVFLIIKRQVTAIRSVKAQGRSRLRWAVWLMTIGAGLVDWIKLYALGSVLNKLRYVNQWCPESGSFKADIRYALSNKNKASSLWCRPHKAASSIRTSIMLALINVIFNTAVFFVKEPKGFLTKGLSVIPSLVLTALLFIKPLTSMMNLHYTQRKFTQKGNFTFTSEAVVALIGQITAALFSLLMAYVVSDLHLFSVVTTRLFSKCGLNSAAADAALDRTAAAAAARKKKAEEEAQAPRSGIKGWFSRSTTTDTAASVTLAAQKSEDESAKAARRTMGIRSALRALIMQWFYSSQLACAFGLLAPALTVTKLHIWNFWVALDLFLGVGMVALYLCILFFHKRFLPHWQ